MLYIGAMVIGTMLKGVEGQDIVVPGIVVQTDNTKTHIEKTQV